MVPKGAASFEVAWGVSQWSARSDVPFWFHAWTDFMRTWDNSSFSIYILNILWKGLFFSLSSSSSLSLRWEMTRLWNSCLTKCSISLMGRELNSTRAITRSLWAIWAIAFLSRRTRGGRVSLTTLILMGQILIVGGAARRYPTAGTIWTITLLAYCTIMCWFMNLAIMSLM